MIHQIAFPVSLKSTSFVMDKHYTFDIVALTRSCYFYNCVLGIFYFSKM